MVTDTRTTLRTDTSTIRTDNGLARERADNTSSAALWIVLAVIAFAGLGYAFYHYSNPANNPSANGTPAASTSSDRSAMPAANDNTNATTQTSPSGTANGAVMNNDTSTAPNTGTPSTTSGTVSSQPSSSATGSTDSTPNASSTAQ